MRRVVNKGALLVVSLGCFTVTNASAFDVDLSAEPTSYFLVGVALERGDDNIVGHDFWGDQLIGAQVMYRSDDVGIGGRVLLSPKLERSSLLELRALGGIDLRYYRRIGIPLSFGIGVAGEAKLAQHFALLYATLFELGATIYEAGTFECRVFAGVRYLVVGSLVSSFLIDPNGFNNENAADELQGERDRPLEGFVRITFSRKVD